MSFAHQGNGKLLKGTSGKLALDCQCCGCPDVVCTGTDGAGWRIVGYTDGMIDTAYLGAPPPSGACGVRPTWDGVFSKYTTTGNGCNYRIDQEYCMDGWRLTFSPTLSEVSLDPAGSDFSYSLRLATGSHVIWEGSKFCGSTFAGIYTQTAGGASGPSSLELEENL